MEIKTRSQWHFFFKSVVFKNNVDLLVPKMRNDLS